MIFIADLNHDLNRSVSTLIDAVAFLQQLCAVNRFLAIAVICG